MRIDETKLEDRIRVSRSPSVRSVAPVEPAKPVDRGEESPTIDRRAAARSDRDDRQDTRDMVAGLASATLSPAARKAFNQLVGEVQQLRRELENSQRRIDYLKALADRDPVSPVLNRRGFIRELSQVLNLAREYETLNALAFVDIDDLAGINARRGHAAGDAVVEYFGEALAKAVGKTNVVGRLAGGQFGVILVGYDAGTAGERLRVIAEDFAAKPIDWQGEGIPIVLRWSVHELRPGEKAEAALLAPERDALVASDMPVPDMTVADASVAETPARSEGGRGSPEE